MFFDISFWISAPKRQIKFSWAECTEKNLIKQLPLQMSESFYFSTVLCFWWVSNSLSVCQFGPEEYERQLVAAYIRDLSSFSTKKWMIAFQWVRGALSYVTTQHLYWGNTLNFNGGFQRRGVFGRFSVACSRTESDPLSCEHHYHDTDRFFHLSWHWLFSICNSYQGHSSRGHAFCAASTSLWPPGERYANTRFLLNQTLCHTRSHTTPNDLQLKDVVCVYFSGEMWQSASSTTLHCALVQFYNMFYCGGK